MLTQHNILKNRIEVVLNVLSNFTICANSVSS